jgi:hypothetical protein
MARIVLVGDVGGCAVELERLQVAPSDVVVQVGDLVDRGPDSPGVLAQVRQRLESGDRHWVQLAGNHDAQYFGGQPFWRERLGDADAALLRTWWLKEWIRVAAAVRTADGEDILVTHAGLTTDAWRRLGEPVTATSAADLLNTRPEELLWDLHGPLWAEASEVYASWLAPSAPLMPFSQAHGHSAIVSYARRTWTCSERIRARSTVDWTARHTTTRAGTARFLAVDPKHGPTGAPTWAPLVLDDATLLA